MSLLRSNSADNSADVGLLPKNVDEEEVVIDKANRQSAQP